MQLLVILSLFLSTALCETSFNNQDPINRNEKRYDNGTVAGNYKFVDGNSNTHDVQYTDGTDQEFKIVSHVVTSANGESFTMKDDFTPEVQADQGTHTTLQKYLHKVLPEITEEELPPVYIRHIPSPVKKVPVVPIIPVPPPQRVARQNAEDPFQVQESQNVYVVSVAPSNTQFGSRLRASRQNKLDSHEAQVSQNVYVVRSIPPNAQLGSRSLVVKHLPSHIEIKGEHTSNRIGRVERIPFGERILTVHVRRNVEQGKQPQVHANHQQVHVVQQPQVQENIPVQKVGEFVHQHKLTAQDIQLVNGFTPEVHQATLDHLGHVAAIRSRLPHIET